ncbi:30S ribosomal protein S1 [Candidatus Dependentiae bacterium]|nr:MAG: 30S ribosomal protein S1 [Candidatus Dependentiae bacterium]
MAKEVIRPEQFARSQNKSLFEDMELELNTEQLQELSDLYEGIFDVFQPGKIITGKIIQVDSDGVLVDIEFKSRGLISKFEFGDHELKGLKAGDDIEVMIDTLENSDGSVVLSYEKAKAMRAWNDIMKHYEAGEPVHGVVTHKVKGGLSVDIGIPAFLPGSQIDLQRVTDFDQFVGQTIPAKIIKVNQKRGNVIISRRKYLSDLRSESRKQIIDTLAEGQVIQGIVKNITNYGVFIDIGGLDGLLHITDMTWGRIAHPSEMVKIGDTVTVKVLSFDKDNEKISLGLKQLNENPWTKVASDLEIGKRIKGKVSSITDYGLFVEVAKDIEGLVHISEISWTDRINDLHKRFKIADEIEILIVSIDTDNRRMSLSIKQLEDNPWESIDKQFKVGDKVHGKISNITDFGIFIQILPGIDGLVHISDLSWTEHIDHPRDRYAIGEEVESAILAIDKENKKISLGIKQLLQDPWDNADTDYPTNSVIEGTISKITNFGAFAKLPSGIEGLAHNSVLIAEQNKKADEIFKAGEKHQFRVINVNKKDRKLGLSTSLEGSTQPEQREARPKRSFTQERRTEPSKVKGSLQIALESALKKNSSDEEK